MELTDFTGAQRISLIGRRNLLEDALKRIRRGGFHILYYEGEGGIGKTAILEEILRLSRKKKNNLTANEVIDFYHMDVHNPEGLIRKIIDTLGEQYFQESKDVMRKVDEARGVGNSGEANTQAERLLSVFQKELAELARERGIVLALDTMEMLEYEQRDFFQDMLRQEMPLLSVVKWLSDSFLLNLRGNVVLLMAGRPSDLPERFKALRRRNPSLQFKKIEMKGFNEEETIDYLKAISRLKSEHGDNDAASRLLKFSEKRGEVAHFLTEGRPILLALIADMVAHGWTLPYAFSRDLKELRGFGREELLPNMEQKIVIRVQESPTFISETICTLAWLRKGATAELLARLMDLRTPDGQWDIGKAQNYIDQVAQLTLVKVRPGNKRVFLHDEMYTLLEKYIFRERSLEDKERVYKIIREYCTTYIESLWQRIEETPGISPLLQAEVRQAYVEEMHYCLRQCPPMGFALYFWLAEEAQEGRDVGMDALLRAELLDTVTRLEKEKALGGLDPDEVDVDAAVRWGIRALFLQNDSDEALTILDKVQKVWKRKTGPLALTRAHLNLYQAVAMIRRAAGEDWKTARELLERAEDMAESMRSSSKERVKQLSGPEADIAGSHSRRADILKALILKYQGDLDRQQGRHYEAVRHYQESDALQRYLEMTRLAPILINLSDAKALIGQFNQARLLAKEAEQRSRRSGGYYTLARALYARALIEVYDGCPQIALRYVNEALDLAERLRDSPLWGLVHLARARAYRYLWHSLTPEEKKSPPDFWKQFFKDAYQEEKKVPAFWKQPLEDAHRAVDFLKNEPPARIRALIERGCIYREMARELYQQRKREDALKFAEKSQRDFEEAAAMAGGIDLPSQQALAWTNLGWLHYYIDRKDRIEEALQRVYKVVPKEYLLPACGPEPPMAEKERKIEARLPFWSILGKAEMLEAWIALDCESLDEAVEHITLSLTYDELIAEEYFDITRAEEGVHRRFLSLKARDIKNLYQYVRDVANDRGLKKPTRFQRFLEHIYGPENLWIEPEEG